MESKQVRFKGNAVVCLVVMSLIVVACSDGDHGDDADTYTVAQSKGENPEQGLSEQGQLEALEKRAAIDGIAKIAFTLTQSVGAYGKTLQNDNWSLQKISNLNAIPNSPKTIVYINAEEAGLNTADLEKQFASFIGVLIIDSNKLMSGTAVWEGNAEPRPASESANQVYPASDLYRALSGGKAVAIPTATALMTSDSAGTIMPIYVDEENLINGFSPQEAKFGPNPVLYALASLDTAKGVIEKPSLARYRPPQEHKPVPRDIPVGVNWDKVQDLNLSSDSYRFRGRYYVLAWKEAVGTVLTARKFVNVLIDSGSNYSACLVSGFKCGIYAADRYKLVKSNSSTGTGEIVVTGSPIRYTAKASVNPGYQIMTYAPPASAWAATSTRETDTWEQLYNNSFTIGVDAGMSYANVWSLNFTSSYSHSEVIRRRTFAWNGYEQVSCASTSNCFVQAGILSANLKVKAAVVSGLFKSTSTDSNWQIWNDTFLNGRYCRNNTGDIVNSPLYNGDQTARSKISWQGWNPTVETAFEIPKGYFTSSTDTKKVTVSGGMDIERGKWTYKRADGTQWVTDGYVLCTGALTTKHAGYLLKGYTGTKRAIYGPDPQSVAGQEYCQKIWNNGSIAIQIGIDAWKN